jgi:uncharacterized protein
MNRITVTEHHDLPAGDFSTWMTQMQGAIRGANSSEVPCDGCTACCTASQFIHIGPDERDTLAHVPAELLFPAPRLAPGNVLMGYDERGHCPMLVDNRCSIYEHRPKTCRTYDCRVFAATGLEPDGDEKEEIAARARRWRFGVAHEADRSTLDAVRAAVAYLRAHPEVLPQGLAPANSTQLAVAAIDAHPAFVGIDEP